MGTKCMEGSILLLRMNFGFLVYFKEYIAALREEKEPAVILLDASMAKKRPQGEAQAFLKKLKISTDGFFVLVLSDELRAQFTNDGYCVCETPEEGFALAQTFTSGCVAG